MDFRGLGRKVYPRPSRISFSCSRLTSSNDTPWLGPSRMTFWKSIVARWSARRRALRYLISLEEGYLRAELIDQQSIRQTKAFLHAVFRASLENVRSRVLIYARSPKPLHLDGCVDALPDVKRNAWYRSNKIAIVGHSATLGFPGNDIQTRARRRGLNLSLFPDEGAALRWFHDRRQGSRRVGDEEHLHEAASLRPAVQVQRRRQDRRQAPHHIVRENLQMGV